MSDSKISDLPVVSSISDTGLLVVVESGDTSQATNRNAKSYFQALPARTVTSEASVTPVIDTYSVFEFQLLATPLAVNNYTGSPYDFQTIIFFFQDDGTPRAISWGTGYVDGGAGLPLITTANKITRVEFQYSRTRTKFMTVSVTTEP